MAWIAPISSILVFQDDRTDVISIDRRETWSSSYPCGTSAGLLVDP
jgi:hypothetical protein